MKANVSRRTALKLAASAAALTPALSACGSRSSAGSEDSSSDSSEGGLSGEITFVAWGSDAELDCDNEVCRKFEEQHPGTTVNFEALNSDYATTVETRFLGGQSPDVIYGHPQTLLSWMREGMLEPITDVYDAHQELWDESVFFTNLYEAYKYEDNYYATPVGADTSVLFYNKDLFDAAGLSYPTKDTTWDELADMCKKLTSRDANGIPQTIGIDSVDGQWQNILYSLGGSIFDSMDNPTKVTLDSPEMLQTLNWIKDNYDNASGFALTEQDQTYITNGFATGQVACYISGVYDIVWLAETEGLNWDIAPIPGTMSKEGDTPILYCGYAVGSQSKNKDLAKEFAYFMTSYDAQVIMGKTGLITSMRKDVAYSDDMLKFDGAPEHNSLRVDNIPYGKNQQGQCLCWGEVVTSITNNIYKMVQGEVSPEEAQAAMQQESADLLAAELKG
ncbi:MAG: ABC transporter substrate-binding protein [Atopobiaceae bacterium]|jgi:multiple sugar transport system substrate-binding protein